MMEIIIDFTGFINLSNLLITTLTLPPALAVGSVKQSGKDKFTEMMCCG